MDKRKNKVDSVVDDFLALTADERKQVLATVKRVERAIQKRQNDEATKGIRSVIDNGPTFIQTVTHEDEPDSQSPAEFFPVAV